ncbi:MAG: carboxypeptidase-like regulatory domain-containing protein [Edaphobacter sp.]|uniref:carboxypeptidase-like regulatory domain-containing protein n=1 Tax=Edaphobacter sp. TaxID=1934404 RepID=UPI002981801B|nr:carboxypeptidase-like regulatory domain-containing protein [Edaphobacter sp.]MDW5265498.1 carboxypeptidase-like regulatory domain-containing protein [Edaphobacter sp.]
MKVPVRNTSSQIIHTFFILWIAILCGAEFFAPSAIHGQMDQGTITGVVQDASSAVISQSNVTLTSIDSGLVLKTTTDANGIYTFSPIKIGNYSVSASSPGFAVTTQEHIHLDVQARLNIVLILKPGAVSDTVTVSIAPPLLQTQSGSVGQVMSTEVINNIPLNGRNAVYVAQLAAGVVQGVGGRGVGTGDFSANGQRPTQNNFILDGIDNNTAVPDFLNGSSFVVNPPRMPSLNLISRPTAIALSWVTRRVR